MASEFSSLLDLAVKHGATHSEIITEIKAKILELLREKFPKTPIDAEIMLDSESGKVKIFSDGEDITPAKFAEKAESDARQYLIGLLDQDNKSNMSYRSNMSNNINLPVFTGFFRILTGLFFYGYNLMFIVGATLWLVRGQKIFFSLLLLFIPVSSLVLSISRKFYQRSGQLLKIFFLVELPLLFISVLAISMPEGTNRFLWFVVGNLFLIPIVIAITGKDFPEKVLLPIMFIKTMTLMIWSYLCLLFTILVPKIISEIFQNTFDNFYYYNPIFDPGAIISFVFYLSLFVLPYLILVLLYNSFHKEPFSKFHTLFAIVIFTLAIGLSFQPGIGKLVKPLETLTSNSTSFANKEMAARVLSPQQEKIKKLITEVNVTRSSYLFTKDSNLNPIFLTLAYPFVYQGPSNTYDLQRAYNLLFTTYQTSIPSQNKSVLLSYRKISYTPTASGALADITIEEEYDNQTNSQQEVIYEFTLFPGSVVTGLKLGPDLEFVGQIAPRGAAQKTYESQLRINRDPALLEQIGTDTYRLRVFPIPSRNDFNTLKGKHQKVQFTYTTTATPDGFALPAYTKLTNVFTTNATAYLQIKTNQKYLPTKFTLSKDGLRENLITLPYWEDYQLRNQKIAVLVDVSLKNKGSANIEQLIKFAKNHQFDLYKYNTQISNQLLSTEINNLVFWGESDLTNILPKLTKSYDAIFIISGSTTPLTNFNQYPFSIDTPVYFVHNKIPAYQLEFVSRIFQGGGQITNSFDDAMQNYLSKLNYAHDWFIINKYFALENTDETTGSLGNLVQFANIAKLVQSSPTNILNNITKMDELNTLAKKAGIVTPYSSLIALVNDQQQILQNFTNQYNRYEDTAMRENLTPQPIRLSEPMFAPLNNFGMFGSSKSSVSLGGGGSMGVIANPAFSGATSYSYGNVIYLLFLPLIVVLPIGFIYFIIKSVRRK